MTAATSITAHRKAKAQIAGQLELPIVAVIPPGMRVLVNSWIRRGWNDDATCARTDNPAFYSDDETVQAAAAQEVCGTCPVRRSCLASALLHDEQGVWGATTETERQVITTKLARLSPYWASVSQASLPWACRTDWQPGNSTTDMGPTKRHETWYAA